MSARRLLCLTSTLVLLAGCGKRDEPRSTPLHLAAREGDVARVQRLLSRRVDINARDSRGRTPLHEAVRSGRTVVVRVLIDRGARVGGARVDSLNRYGWTPAVSAMSADHRPLVEYLVNAGAGVTLHVAAYLGDVAKARDLIAGGADIHAGVPAGWTPLHYAARSDQAGTAEVLLAAGAEVNARMDDGTTPLHVAAMKDAHEVARLLLENGAHVEAMTHYGHGGTALDMAASYGNAAVARVLIAGGAGGNDEGWGSGALYVAADEGWTSVVSLLLEAGAEPSSGLLRVAVGHRYIGIVRLVASRVSDIDGRDSSGRAALHEAVDSPRDESLASYEVYSKKADPVRMGEDRYAVLKEDRGELEMLLVELLLDHGADVNAEANDGRTPLHEAVHNGRRSGVVELLIARGANVNAATDGGVTPLHHAADSGRNDAATLLLARGANVNARDDWGRTPLHKAALQGCEATVDLLLAAGADPTVKDNAGETPLDYARQRGHEALAERLGMRGTGE